MATKTQIFKTKHAIKAGAGASGSGSKSGGKGGGIGEGNRHLDSQTYEAEGDIVAGDGGAGGPDGGQGGDGGGIGSNNTFGEEEKKKCVIM